MQLSPIQVGDVVLVDKRGAASTPSSPPSSAGELRLRPIERNISYTTATAREIVAHWRKSKSSTPRPAAGGGERCEHRFVSIKGSPRHWFEAALTRGDAAGAWAAAHDLGQLTLPDALALCLLLRDQHPPLYERAAARWAARLTLETRAMRLADLGLAVAALQAHGAELDAAADALAALCEQHGQADVAGVLERWTDTRGR